jgi:hypothetical protein
MKFPSADAGLGFMIAGLWALLKSFDRRPVVVVDGEGLFYRPQGESIIPWRDICADQSGRLIAPGASP